MKQSSEEDEDVYSLMRKASKEELEILEPELPEPEVEPSIFDRIKGLGEKILPLMKMGGPGYTQAKMMLEKGVESRLEKERREEELAKRRPEMAPEMPTISALTPEQKRGYETGESLRKYLWLYPPEVKKEAAGIFKDPKVNYYADVIAKRLPLWLTAFAGAPGIIGIFEALIQLKNVTVSVAESSKYDPLASRQLSELIPEDAPEWLRTGASIGEGATDMILAAIAAKKIKFEAFKSNMERALNYAEKIGYPKDLVGVWRKAVADSAGDISRFRSLEQEIKTMMKSTRTMRSPMMRGISEVAGAPETAIRPPEIAPKVAPRLMAPATRIATERGTIFAPETPEAERLAAMYREVEPKPPETKVNINPKADGSVDVTWTKPTAVEPAPILYEKKDMLESIWAIFEEHPRVLWKDLVKYAEGNEEIATASEIATYFESKGKEVLGKPKAKKVGKEIKPFKYKDELLQDINDLVGKIKPNPDYSRSELQKILPLRMIGAERDPDAKEMDIAAQLLSHKYPNIEGDVDLYDTLAARKKLPARKEPALAEEERAAEEYEEFKEREAEKREKTRYLEQALGKPLATQKEISKDIGDYIKESKVEVEGLKKEGKYFEAKELESRIDRIKDEKRILDEKISKQEEKKPAIVKKPKKMYRLGPEARAIEKAIKEGKELTAEQKEFLKERGIYEEKKIAKKVEPPEPEIEKLPERMDLAKLSIETPTGEMEDLGELTADRIDRIKKHAKQLGLEGKLKVGATYKGKWGERLSPSQIEEYMKEVITDVKKVPKEDWELYFGYPITKEIKEAISRIRERYKTKKRVRLEELKTELQKTDTGKVEWMYLETERQLKEKRKPSFKKAFRGAKHAFVDTSGNVKKDLIKDMGPLGKEAAIQHDLIAGANAKAERLFEEASKDIYKGLSKDEEMMLNRAIQSRRTAAISEYRKVDEDAVNALEAKEKIWQERIERWGGRAREKAEREVEKIKREKNKLLAKGIRHPHGLTGEQHDEFLKTIPEEINERADLYFKEMEKVLDDLKSEGLIDEDSYQNLKSKGVYSPRRFIQYIDPPAKGYDSMGRIITVPDSGIKALDAGSQQVMETNSRLLLSSVISRTQARIFRNRANKAAYDLAKEIPDNGIFKPAKVYKTTKEGKPIYQEAPAGHTKIKAMIEGETKELIMRDEHAREWLTRDPLINEQAALWIGWLSGSKFLKPMATGLNPGFALTNFPRDVAHVWIVTSEYSSFVPKFTFQIARDFMATAKDTFLRKGRWVDYLDEGGGMTFLTHQGKPFKTMGKRGIYTAIKGLQQALGYVGETSEIWTRLALRERALRQGKSPHEATWIARNYIDFNQGGNFAKALDTGIPYLNAGVQGTRGIFRALADRPTDTLWKFVQLAVLASGLYLANNLLNKECMDHITDREKVNNWIFSTPFRFTDKNGNKRYLYFKIAKDQGQRIACTIVENLMRKALGKEVNSDQIVQSVQDFIPIVPDQLMPPSIDGLMGYVANRDFWTRKDIWRGDKITPREEYTIYTHPALVKLGKATGWSPERLEYFLSQVFTRGNVYTSLVGGGLTLAMKDLPEKDKRKTTTEIVSRLPLIKRVFGVTPPYSVEEIKKLEKASMEESTRKHKQKRELTELANTYYRKLKDEKIKDRSVLNEIKVFIRKQPVEDRKRLVSWFKRYGIVYDIPDKSWWLNLAEMPPEARATVFWLKYLETEEADRKGLKRLAKRIPGLWSPRFLKRLRILINKWKKEQ